MDDITIRKIRESDLNNGFLESLDNLKAASNLGNEKARAILKKITANPDNVIFVAVLDNKVVGSVSLIIEQKFIHDGGLVGHIEDVVVSKEHEGKGIGFKIMQAALEYAKNQGCYKTILDCDDKVKPFYERLGFKAHSNGMRFDH
ncbi:MAG TPA: GNAT family N-acetyltransferase [Candidatus Nitrosotenuis sp.]|nr:GNAT family N-acetyltransferase [Candidatus Nitrosotenuis sp.]